jgi:hypothetical protein
MARKKSEIAEPIAAVEPVAPVEEIITSYKGFDKDLACSPSGGVRVEYKVGETYAHTGEVHACKSGFHACENPLSVFAFYPPKAGHRYAKVQQSGKFDREATKIASGRIFIEAELKLPDILRIGMEWVAKRIEVALANPSKVGTSGDSSTGAASGNSSTGAASGNYSTGAASGNSSTGAASGDYSTAATAGSLSKASVTGKHSCALSGGLNGNVMGAEGCALFLVHRAKSGAIKHAWAGIVGRDGICPNVWYVLGADGKPQEV